MHVDGVGEPVVVRVPHGVQEIGAGDDETGPIHEVVQERELASSERHEDTAAADGVRRRIERDVAHRQLRAAGLVRSAQQGPHTRRQLGEVEGLGEIVVRAGVQSEHLVTEAVASREHEDPRAAPRRTELTAQREPVPVGQTKIEDHEMVARSDHQTPGLGQGLGQLHRVSVLGETALDHCSEGHIIFDHEDTHEASSSRETDEENVKTPFTFDSWVIRHGARMADTPALAHVLRRLSFGPSPGQIASLGELTAPELIEQLLAAPALEPAPPELGTDDDYNVLPRWWLEVMGDAAAGVHERLVWFWHGHLTSALSKCEPALMLRQHLLLRANALGNFRELMQSITTDAAMLVWLDGNWSQVQSPNENYAREVMELFCLGRGNYSEADVRAGARLFSGWWVDGENGNTVQFDASIGPTQSYDFLGSSASTAAEAIDVICSQPACAPFITGKIYEYLVGAPPDDDVRSELASAFADSGLDIATLVAGVVRHPTFLEAVWNKPRSAVEYFVATRAFLATPIDHWPLYDLGQVPFDPPNVAGWPGTARWISSGAVLSKAQIATDNSYDTPTIAADDPVAAVLLDAGLSGASNETTAALRDAASSVQSRRDLASVLYALTVSCPEFSLA